MRQVLRVITTVIIVIVVLGGFSVAYGAVERIEILTFPASEDVASLPLYVGIKKCFYKEEELEPKIVYGVDTHSGTHALSKEGTDYYIGPPARMAMFIATENLPIRMIFFYSDKNLLYLMTQSQIKSIGGLKGKIIGIDFYGSMIDYALRRALKKHGLDPDKDVTIRDLHEVSRAFTDLVVEKSVHAVVLPLPSNIFAEREGFHELRDFREEIVPMPLLALATTQKKIEENPEQIEKMLKIARKSLLYTREYKDDVVSIMEDLMNEVDKETLYIIYDSLIEGLSRDGYIDTKSLYVLIKQIRERFAIEEEISISNVFNLSLLEKVLAIHRLIIVPVAAQCPSPKRKATRWDLYYWLTQDASKVTATVLTSVKRQYIWDDSMRDRYKSQNPHRFIWYGKNKKTGKYVEPGEYTCRIKSINAYTHSKEVDFSIEEYRIPVE